MPMVESLVVIGGIFWDQGDVPMIPGVLIQEETVGYAANA